jgi:hypothetical protein
VRLSARMLVPGDDLGPRAALVHPETASRARLFRLETRARATWHDGVDETSRREEKQALTPPATIEQDAPPNNEGSLAERMTRTVQVTYSPKEWALLQAAFPMSEDEWDAMIEVLQAMKRGLVSSRDKQ